MKPYFIYTFDHQTQKPDIDSGYRAYIHKAKNEIDALKQYHIYLNGYYAKGNYFRSNTYHAVCNLEL